ncbi:MAG TPA: hypothetical protein VFQ35_26950 [Polyangiaceae bacterium]|nr:hypothetical protein [Polyangiaceae bacterium]
MAKFWMIGLSCLALASGCTPGREAKTAGQIGCTPDEITISNHESHFGLVQSGDTWVAECQGRTFVCSQLNEAGNDKGFFDSLFASEQVSCHEAPESQEAMRRRITKEVAATEQARRPAPSAPTGAAGFAFGASPEEAAKGCESAGYAWRSGGEGAPSGCSGPAALLGISANVNIRFCEGHTCAITVEHVPRSHWMQGSVSLKANLESKYGPAQESSGIIPEQCRSERGLTRCLESRALTLRYVWRWASGESLEMSVGKPSEAAISAIRLEYRRVAGAANLSAL